MLLLRVIKNEYINLVANKRFALLRGIKRYFVCYEFKINVWSRIALTCKCGFIKKGLLDRLKKRGVHIGTEVKWGENVLMPHPVGIVIGEKVTIGNNCVIYQGVTIGKKNGEYPKIGDNVVIYPNSMIIGNIVVGEGAIVGAGSVVLDNVLPNSIVAGCPARLINGAMKDEKSKGFCCNT